MRRVVVTLELETNVSLRDLKAATLTVRRWGKRAWHLKTDRNDEKDVDAIARNWGDGPIIYYLESNRVNVIRESTAKRGKR